MMIRPHLLTQPLAWSTVVLPPIRSLDAWSAPPSSRILISRVCNASIPSSPRRTPLLQIAFIVSYLEFQAHVHRSLCRKKLSRVYNASLPLSPRRTPLLQIAFVVSCLKFQAHVHHPESSPLFLHQTTSTAILFPDRLPPSSRRSSSSLASSPRTLSGRHRHPPQKKLSAGQAK